MSHFVIRGGKPLDGAVSVSGAKNSVLPILAARCSAAAAAPYITVPTCGMCVPLWISCGIWAAKQSGRGVPSRWIPPPSPAAMCPSA